MHTELYSRFRYRFRRAVPENKNPGIDDPKRGMPGTIG
ncbi:hypothetical protein LEP1GSC062_4010 [Leptospira alexanderi serovar Manhao 3 str. L 60]|uniref:Uncharacterized protein n=1 Tax=Leptospira alexanderi serovar Manhao 3 str. L 60 TaxID=1049759 RepID=V6IG95_9LEPT|nr:hypothetical protein LEP1GSC062_4010 [Leptospira alexanderi serovar Manhao 3 str. L 60]